MKSNAQKIVDYQINKRKTDLPKSGFYVYAITKENIVIYIGKGTKKRVLTHFTRSTNAKLAYDLKENPALFDYFILDCFDEEIESFEFEESLIKECKALKIKLYNSTHYCNGLSKNKELQGYLMLLNQFDKMVFLNQYANQNFTPLARAKLLLDMIKENFSNYIEVPKYKGKNITELKASEEITPYYTKIIIE